MEEDILSTVLRGCLMARELEANLPNVAHQPNLLQPSCDEIASNRLLNSSGVEVIANLPEENKTEIALNLPERFNFVGDGGAGGASVIAAGSSVQRSSSRRRMEETARRTIKAPALLTGNLDIPPDDGYTWRKFGQKDIIRARFPRCTHKNFYSCDTKKKVQWLDDNPLMYEVTYYREHICNTIPTPPPLLAFPTLSPPAARSVSQTDVTTSLLPPSTSPLYQDIRASTSLEGFGLCWFTNLRGGDKGDEAGSSWRGSNP